MEPHAALYPAVRVNERHFVKYTFVKVEPAWRRLDPDERLAFAYVVNRSGPRWQNPRNRALLDALYAAL